MSLWRGWGRTFLRQQCVEISDNPRPRLSKHQTVAGELMNIQNRTVFSVSITLQYMQLAVRTSLSACDPCNGIRCIIERRASELMKRAERWHFLRDVWRRMTFTKKKPQRGAVRTFIGSWRNTKQSLSGGGINWLCWTTEGCPVPP